jgi:murein DD-endopeptidase MepM/ murein hydrolase activator NlpD
VNRRALVLVALGLLLVWPRVAGTQPVRLGGLLPLDDDVVECWPWSGAWIWPVGAPTDLARPDGPDQPRWQVLRGFRASEDRDRRHLGLDLGNGRARGPVRASANGVVILARDRRGTSGFGRHVVLAHRLRQGGIVFSVYAHLRPGSIRVRRGQCVWAGETLGDVGRSGRATADHLHFEVRRARDSGARWEQARAVDPLAFVSERLPQEPPGPSWAGPYLAWAGWAGLVDRGARASDRLSRSAWHSLLARAARLALLAPVPDPETLRERLVEESLLPVDDCTPPDETVSWREVGRDLKRLAEIGTRLPPGPHGTADHRTACRSRLGLKNPMRNLRKLRSRRIPPTLGDACLLVAGLAPSGERSPTAGRSAR